MKGRKKGNGMLEEREGGRKGGGGLVCTLPRPFAHAKLNLSHSHFSLNATSSEEHITSLIRRVLSTTPRGACPVFCAILTLSSHGPPCSVSASWEVWDTQVHKS